MTKQRTAEQGTFSYRINVLGGFNVLPSEGQPAGLQGRLLLAALSAAPSRRLERAHLIDVLWPSAKKMMSDSAVRVAVNRAKEWFGADGSRSIVAANGAYFLSPSVETDADEWLRLVREAERCRSDDQRTACDRWTQARKLWRGVPYEEFDSPLIDSARLNLQSAWRTASIREIQVLLKCDVSEAAYRAEQLFGVIPDSEDVATLAIETLAAAGRTKDGLEVAAQFRSSMKELGLLVPARIKQAEALLFSSAPPAVRNKSLPIPAPVKTGSILEIEKHKAPVSLAKAETGVNRSLPETFADGNAAESRGDFAEASAAWWTVVAQADPESESSLLARAALAGSGYNSNIGGDFERRRRLRLAATRLAEHALRDEVVADLALESFNCRFGVDSDLDAEVRSIAKRPESTGYVLALRWVVAADQTVGRATLFDAQQLAQASLEISGASPHQRSAGLTVAVGVGLSCGAFELADFWASELEALGEKTNEPRARWQSIAFRSVLAETAGRLDRGQELALKALHVGRSLGMLDAEATFGLHLMGRALRHGSLASFAPALASAADKYKFPIWTMLRASAEADAGNETIALKLLRDHLSEVLEQIDHFTPAAIAIAAKNASRLGDRNTIERLRPVLSHRAEQFLSIGYGGPCIGPRALFQAQLAAACGELNLAEKHFEDALRICAHAGAHSWTEHVRLARAATRLQ
jgi:DNA-binding SARP family transcriptional activator